MIKKVLLFLLLTGQVGAVTRIYPNFNVVAPVSPSTGFTAWSDVTQNSGYVGMSTGTSGGAMGNFGCGSLDASTLDSILVYISVSAPLSDQTISGTIKGQCRGFEAATTNNAHWAFALAVVSNNGDTLRGVLLNTSAPNNTTNELATTSTNRKLMDGLESASLNLTSTVVVEGDRLVAYWGIQENATAADAALNLSLGDDSGTDLPEDITTTAANNPWFELSGDLVFQAPPPAGDPHPAQPQVAPCEFTMIPSDTGDTTMNWTFSPAITNRVDAFRYVDDSLACGAARFPAAESCLLLSSTTWKSIHFGLSNPTSGCDGQQIDAITIRICARAADGPDGGTGVGPCSLRVGIKVNPLDSLSMFRFILSTATVLEKYLTFPGQINSSIRGDRWTKDSLTNMIVTIQGYCDSGTVDTLSVGSIYVLAHHSVIDASVPDSTDEDIERAITGAWTNEPAVRTGEAFWQSMDTLTANAYQKLWAFSNDNVTVRTWAARASPDSGATWTTLSGPIGGEDSFQLARNPAQPALTTSVGGPCVFNQWRNRNDDTLFAITGGNTSTPATASHLIFAFRPPVVDTTDETGVGFWGAAGSTRNDTITAGTAVTLRNSQALTAYALDDTLWVGSIFTANNNTGATNALGWTRSNNKGETWASGTSNAIDTIGSGTIGGQVPITGSPNVMNAQFVPWRTTVDSAHGPYPGAFCRSSAVPCGEVYFYQWNPLVAAESAWGHINSTNNYKPLKVCSLISCNSQTGCNSGQSGEIRATTVWRSPTNMQAHAMWVGGGKIFHAIVSYNGSTVTSDTNTIWESENCENTQFDITNLDTLVYAVWRYNDSLSASAGSVLPGTSKFWFSIWNGQKWRAPRPVTMSKSIAGSNKRNIMRVSLPRQLNKKSDYVPILMAGNPATSSNSSTTMYFSKILKRAAAAGGAPTPLRRRRLIIEKNYRTGEIEDTTGHWQFVQPSGGVDTGGYWWIPMGEGQETLERR